MKILALVVIAAASLWSGYWFVQAQATRALTNAWFEDMRAEGWDAGYAGIDIEGFPNRVDATFRDVTLADPATGFAWEAPFFQVLRLVYDQSHFIFAWPDRQTVDTPDARFDVASEGFRASLVLGPGDTVGRLHAEAVRLSAVSETAGRFDLSDLRINLDAIDAGAATYRLLAAGRDGRAADRDITVRGEVTFEAAPSLSGGPVQVTLIDLDTVEYALPGARLRLSGRVEVDDEGRLTGDVDIEARDWQALLEGAVEEGRVPEDVAETLESALGLVARIRGSASTLDVGLRLEDGTAYLGPVALGEAPRVPVP